MKETFLSIIRAEMAHCLKENHHGQLRKLKCVLHSFQNFLSIKGEESVQLSGITESLILAYQDWLLSRGIRKNSSSCYIRTLQALYNKAVADVPNHHANPFAKAYRGIAKTRKRATTIGIVQKLRQLDIRSGLIALNKNPQRKTFPALLHKLEMTRDLFIFSYCVRGMSFVDVAYLKKTDVQKGVIYYRRRKTGQTMEVELVQVAEEIIGRYARETKGSPYLFPLLHSPDEAEAHREYQSALRTYNAYLKLLSQMLGENVCLTSYVARHSWASHIYQSGAPFSVISQGLGHDSELTTRIYVKSLENNAVHEANRVFIEQIINPPLLASEAEDFRAQNYNFFLKSKKEMASIWRNIVHCDFL